MRLLGEDIKFRENLVFSINRYSVWWIILIITMCFDYLSTTVFVEKYGSEAEANLTTRFMMDYFSPYFGNLFGPPPPSVLAIALLAQAQWLLVIWGFWIDRHRAAHVLEYPTPTRLGSER